MDSPLEISLLLRDGAAVRGDRQRHKRRREPDRHLLSMSAVKEADRIGFVCRLSVKKPAHN